jgi:hypothetical protein
LLHLKNGHCIGGMSADNLPFVAGFPQTDHDISDYSRRNPSYLEGQIGQDQLGLSLKIKDSML